MRISQVSRRWRNVAIRSSSLWTRLYFSDVNPKYHLLPMLIERSKGRPLDVTLAIKKWTGITRNMLSLLESLRTHIDRWQRLTISTTFATQMRLLMNIIEDACAPRLEFLCLDPGDTNLDNTDEMQSIFTRGAPRLLSLKLRGFVAKLPNAPRLNRVHLSRVEHMPVNNERFRDLLLSTSRLEHLHISSCLPPPTPSSAVHLPLLHSLSIEDMQGLHTAALLKCISAPALRCLYLFGALCTEWGLFAYMRRTIAACGPFPALRLFECHGQCLDELIDIKFFLGMPVVERVIIGDSNADFIIQALIDDPTMWPCLEELSMTGYSHDLLRDLVSARTAIGKPLRKLDLSCNDMQNQQFVTWLGERVEVVRYILPTSPSRRGF